MVEMKWRSFSLDENQGARLKGSREAKLLGRSTVGFHFGVSGQVVQNWEEGRTLIDMEELENLCVMYDVTPKFILFGS